MPAKQAVMAVRMPAAAAIQAMSICTKPFHRKSVEAVHISGHKINAFQRWIRKDCRSHRAYVYVVQVT